jgi:molybdopterin molybdotransferase
MLSVNEAIATLLEGSNRLVKSEDVSLDQASGRTLASDIIAPIDVPPADNSAMDGYAIRFADWQDSNTGIPITLRITAGTVPDPLEQGSVARIFTGAEVPPGADTVVMQEHCEETDGLVRVLKMPARGAEAAGPGPGSLTGIRCCTGLPPTAGGRHVDRRRITGAGRKHPARADL